MDFVVPDRVSPRLIGVRRSCIARVPEGDSMSNRLIELAATLAAFACPYRAQAEALGSQPLSPIQGKAVPLVNLTDVAHFAVERLSYRVVAALNGKAVIPTRIIEILRPEQTAIVSVPRGPRELAPKAVFGRHGRRLLVAQVFPP
jgi:hypothetical protein